VNYFKWLADHGYLRSATYFRNFCIWATVIITVVSGLLYIQRALAMYREGRMREEAARAAAAAPTTAAVITPTPPPTKTTGATA